MGAYHSPPAFGPTTLDLGNGGPTFSTIPTRRARIASIMPPGSPAGHASVQLQRQLAMRANRPGGVTALGDDDQLGGLFSSIGKAVKNVGKTVVKAVKDTGHVAGTVVTSKIGQAVVGGALALTGVGLPAAIAIGAGAQAAGNIIKPGGNLGKAAKGAVVGGAEGAAGSLVGSLGRKLLSSGDKPPAPIVDTATTLLPPITSSVPVAPDLVLPATTEATAPAAMTPTEVAVHQAITSPANAPSTIASAILSPSTTDKLAIAKKAHDTAQSAKKQSQTLADRAKKLGANAASIQRKAEALAAAGDSLGAGQLAAQARAIAGVAQNTQQAADTAADYSQRVGNAIAAGTDAAIGAAGTNSEAFGNLVAWVEANPAKAAIVGAGVTFGLYKLLGRGSSRRRVA